MLTSKEWWKAAGIRALKTVAQVLGSELTVGVISAQAIKTLNIEFVYVVVAWLCTGLIAGLYSLLTSLAGLPELEDTKKEGK